MKIKILELKNIQSENFSHYVKYESKLFFWSKPEVCEAFKHKTKKIFIGHLEMDHNCWFNKEGYEIKPNLGIYFGEELNKRQADIKRRMLQTELNLIKI